MGIELVQLVMLLSWMPRRSVDVDDVILNVTGAVIGYLTWLGVRTAKARLGAKTEPVTESA